jgi:hypothetical protein
LYFPFPHRTSLFLCVTLHLCASAIKSTDVFRLNELVDISKIYAKELSRIRGITSANLNTFSNANRTRNPTVMEKFFWMMYDHFKSQDASFVKAKHKGKLSRFKLRNIYAIDSTIITLAYWCIK